ncbi:imm68 putative immunity domain-containing protein [Bacteroides faecichinchillae]|uniref:imm68 putative immunity domain-containing protein n=1 Tax=Bacteroides faecichinchillae TaxID=871325 RepID=UPI0027153699|nr:imm68 putative immunity domain-containing protein [Bacteroides faecichinchillae]
MNVLLKEDSVNEGDAYFSINESKELHFDMVIDVVIELSAILLESTKNKEVDIKIRSE